MLDQLDNFPILKKVLESLETNFKDSILDKTFEKNELSVLIKKEDLIGVLTYLKTEQGFNALNDMIGIDNLPYAAEGKKRFSVYYQLYRFQDFQRIRIKVDTEENEGIDSIVSLYKSSDWAEREIYDMFGITFSSHPDLRRIYTPDNFEGYPLRKDFPMEGKK